MRELTQGVVELQVVIRSDGMIGAARVTRSLHRELDRTALIAARYWLFEPGSLKGEPITCRAEMALDYRLH